MLRLIPPVKMDAVLHRRFGEPGGEENFDARPELPGFVREVIRGASANRWGTSTVESHTWTASTPDKFRRPIPRSEADRDHAPARLSATRRKLGTSASWTGARRRRSRGRRACAAVDCYIRCQEMPRHAVLNDTLPQPPSDLAVTPLAHDAPKPAEIRLVRLIRWEDPSCLSPQYWGIIFFASYGESGRRRTYVFTRKWSPLARWRLSTSFPRGVFLCWVTATSSVPPSPAYVCRPGGGGGNPIAGHCTTARPCRYPHDRAPLCSFGEFVSR